MVCLCVCFQSQDCTQQKNTLEERVKTLRSEVKGLEQTLKQLSRDVEVLGVQGSSLTQRIQHLKNQPKEQEMDPEELRRMEKQVATYQRERQKAEQAAKTVQDEVNRYVARVAGLEGVQFFPLPPSLPPLPSLIPSLPLSPPSGSTVLSWKWAGLVCRSSKLKWTQSRPI